MTPPSRHDNDRNAGELTNVNMLADATEQTTVVERDEDATEQTIIFEDFECIIDGLQDQEQEGRCRGCSQGFYG